jgi:putative transposase
VSARYEFIDAEKATTTPDGMRKYSVVKMCEWLEVSTSGYYEWRGRPRSATAIRREYLHLLVKRIFDDSDETYGYRRVHAQLARQGEHCTPELVRSVMRELGLVPCQPRPWRHCLTEADERPAPIPDLVDRDFTAAAPGVKMVGDITYIPTWEGWVYLATVIDCYSKAVIGWAVGDNYKTPLIAAAIRMAARNHTLASGAVFHSDRGSNYTSAEFAGVLSSLGLRRSVGRTGICYDNAMAESFFAALKNERVHRTVYPTREHARRDVARYIELHYNAKRLHSGLGYRTPNEVLQEFLKGQAAA